MPPLHPEVPAAGRYSTAPGIPQPEAVELHRASSEPILQVPGLWIVFPSPGDPSWSSALFPHCCQCQRAANPNGSMEAARADGWQESSTGGKP